MTGPQALWRLIGEGVAGERLGSISGCTFVYGDPRGFRYSLADDVGGRFQISPQTGTIEVASSLGGPDGPPPDPSEA
jgi:hypothetical protein